VTANDRTDSVWHELLVGWPLWLRIAVVLFGFVLLCFVIFGVSFLIIKRNMDVEIGLKGFKATRPETTLEKNCHMASQEASARDQSFNSEILALQALRPHRYQRAQPFRVAPPRARRAGATADLSGAEGNRLVLPS
jgi:hypothetical protein